MKSTRYVILLLALTNPSVSGQQFRNLEEVPEEIPTQPTIPGGPIDEQLSNGASMLQNQISGEIQNQVQEQTNEIQNQALEQANEMSNEAQKQANQVTEPYKNAVQEAQKIEVHPEGHNPQQGQKTQRQGEPQKTQVQRQGQKVQRQGEPQKTQVQRQGEKKQAERVETKVPVQTEQKIEQTIEKQAEEVLPTESKQEEAILQQVNKEIIDTDPILAKEIKDISKVSEGKADELEKDLEDEARAIVKKENLANDEDVTPSEEEAEVNEEVKKIIKNRGIKDSEFDSLLNATMNAIPGLDADQKKEYHEQVKKSEYYKQVQEQFVKYDVDKEKMMKIVGAIVGATGITCCGLFALCKRDSEEEQYAEQKDEIEFKSTGGNNEMME